MKLIRGLDLKDLCPAGASVTLGNFDGVHRGHLRLVERTIAHAKRANTTPVLITFEPLPRAFFNPANPPKRLTRPADKLLVLAESGLALTWVMPFGKRLAAMSARDFVSTMLVRGVNARHVVIGKDFHFGAGRAGDVATLRGMGEAHGFGVETIDDHCVGADRVSSSAIRSALAAGDLSRVGRMLGRRFSISGRVCRGKRIGRTLGFPTANIPLRRYPSPVHGVFAVRVRGVDKANTPWPGVASVGIRPAVGGRDWTLEAHLFDYSGDLYGRRIRVEFVTRLRDELNFASLEALTRQMRHDAAQARNILQQLESQTGPP